MVNNSVTRVCLSRLTATEIARDFLAEGYTKITIFRTEKDYEVHAEGKSPT